jgi:hypothetical protein
MAVQGNNNQQPFGSNDWLQGLLGEQSTRSSQRWLYKVTTFSDGWLQGLLGEQSMQPFGSEHCPVRSAINNQSEAHIAWSEASITAFTV